MGVYTQDHMVQSKLHQNIQYVESHRLEEGEFGHDSALYNLPLRDGVYVVAIGKKQDQYSHYNVFFFPIYLISPQQKIKAKIGVFEVEAKRVLDVYNKNTDDLDLDKLDDPLVFHNVNDEFLRNYGIVVEDSDSETEEVLEKKVESKVESMVGSESDSDSDSDSDSEMFSLKRMPGSKSKTGVDTNTNTNTPDDNSNAFLTLDNIFIKEEALPSQITFPAETEEDAREFVSEYKSKKATTDNWIQQYMKNKHYEILRNEGSGDCFFAALRDAYSQLGFTTTVAKLRQFLSQEATLELMEQYDLLYKNYLKEIQYLEEEMDKSKKMMTALKKQNANAATKGGQKEILTEAKKLQSEYNQFKSKLSLTQELLKEVQFIKHVENLEQFKTYIQTTDYWADTWAISTLERILNLKVVVLEQSEDDHAVLQCGQMNDEEALYANYDPQYYVLLSKVEEHYELVMYRKKKMLTFAEVPYGVKYKILEKCMEKNAGPYAILPAFKQFQMDMGRQPILPPSEKGEMPQEEEGLYNDDVVFQFFKGSSNAKPGRGSGEKMGTPKEKGKRVKISQRELDFDQLRKIEDWRKKLADTWTKASFSVDNRKWASVSHYLMALPFEKDYNTIFEEFSLDSNSELSKDLDKAEQSIEKKKKGVVGKHYEVYKTLNELSDEAMREERKKALRAKFLAGDMTTLLHETKDAKLMMYRYGQEPKADIDLMMLRKEIQNIASS